MLTNKQCKHMVLNITMTFNIHVICECVFLWCVTLLCKAK